LVFPLRVFNRADIKERDHIGALVLRDWWGPWLIDVVWGLVWGLPHLASWAYSRQASG